MRGDSPTHSLVLLSVSYLPRRVCSPARKEFTNGHCIACILLFPVDRDTH